MKPVVIHKYGGSSLAQGRDAIVGRTREAVARGERGVIVVSARGNATDVLLRKGLQRGFLRYSEAMDRWLALGEHDSVRWLTACLREAGVPAVGLDAFALGLRASSQPGRAQVLGVAPERLQAALAEAPVVVVPGFLGVDAAGVLRTLGRGGSDWTALALAHALQAPCAIFSDVDGIYTADPKYVPGAQRLEAISHAALLALACSGAQVMQARAMRYAQAHAIRFTVGSYAQNSLHTQVVSKTPSQGPVWGVALHRRQAYVTLSGLGSDSGLPAELFQALSAWELFIDLFWQESRTQGLEMAFTLDYDELPLLTHCLQSAFGAIKAKQLAITSPIAKLSVLQAKDREAPPLDPQRLEGLKPLRTLSLPDRLVWCLPQSQALEAYRAAHGAFVRQKA